jgi:hypothetical protein
MVSPLIQMTLAFPVGFQDTYVRYNIMAFNHLGREGPFSYEAFLFLDG